MSHTPCVVVCGVRSWGREYGRGSIFRVFFFVWWSIFVFGRGESWSSSSSMVLVVVAFNLVSSWVSGLW